MEDNLTLKKLKEKFPDSILEVTSFRGEVTVLVRKEDILRITSFLKEAPELAYDFLTDLCAVDYFPKEPRFQIVYHLYSLKNRERLRIKAGVGSENPTISSVTSVWKAANFPEREGYDLFGIEFKDHPDLRRILLPEDFEGYPLRKDYPLKGR